MWQDGQDTSSNDNDEGVRVVRLYQPIPYSRQSCCSTGSSAKAVVVAPPTVSHVGGLPSYYATDDVVDVTTPQCNACKEDMYLLLQLYTPEYGKERTLYVFGCNSGTCVASAFDDGSSTATATTRRPFALDGGNGRFVCRHSQPSTAADVVAMETSQKTTASSESAVVGGAGGDHHQAQQLQLDSDSPLVSQVVHSPWSNEDKHTRMDDDDTDENDWNAVTAEEDDDNDVNDDVEAMLDAMEMNECSKAKTRRKEKAAPKSVITKKKKKSKDGVSSSSLNNTPQSPRRPQLSFPFFEIHSLQEPASVVVRSSRHHDMDYDDDDDDDYVGTVAMGGDSDVKIQQMLARYMAEEEDEDIIAAIQGSYGGGGGSSSSRDGGEKDERLPAEDRAILAFTDRVKRAPRQIVRYARGGVPLWSVPWPRSTREKTPPKSGRGRRHVNDSTPKPDESTSSFDIPNCSCGAPRQFECQLMPNLLSVLDVDKYARSSSANGKHSSSSSSLSSSKLRIDELMSRNRGGMNWGVVAIYTCSAANCDKGRNDYIIVQDSVDGNPEMRPGPTNDDMVVTDMDKDDAEKYVDGDDFFADC